MKKEEKAIEGISAELVCPSPRLVLRIFIQRTRNPKSRTYVHSIVSENGRIPRIGERLMWQIESLGTGPDNRFDMKAIYKVIDVLHPYTRYRISSSNDDPTPRLDAEVDITVKPERLPKMPKNQK